jgi:hypothetical protein
MICFGLAALALRAPAAEVVYSNTTDDPLAPWNPIPNGVEIGDDVTLEGTARNVTQFSTTFYNNLPSPLIYSGDFTARFYALDNDGNPGAKLWEGTTTINNGILGDRPLTWDVPNVTVPDTFIWTVQFDTNLATNDDDGLGPLLNDVPQVGSSEDVFFENRHQGAGWEALFYGGIPMANFVATVTADVPEPGSLGLFALGAAGLLARRRR